MADWTQLRQRALLVVLVEDDRLAVVGRTIWYQARKYRGAAKLSTAFRMRKLKTEDREIGTYGL